MRQRLSGVFAACSVVLLATLVAPNQAQAVEFLVNSTLDQVDANPGDGICASSAGLCTLRAAVMETNALPNSPSYPPLPDTIRIPPGKYPITIPGINEDEGATGDIDILDGLKILGTASNDEIEIGFVSPSADTYRRDGVIEIHLGVYVEMDSVAIVKGDNGYGSGNASAITNRGDLRLTHVRVEDNLNASAIENLGSLFVRASVFRRNRGFLGPGFYGGAIRNGGTMVLLDSVIANNGSENLGAILNDGAAFISGCTFENNETLYSGGAIRNSGFVSIAHSSFVGSRAFSGGGIYNDTTGVLDIHDSELRGNKSNNSAGYGIAIFNAGRATVSGTTIAGNQPASYLDSVFGAGINSSGQIYIINSTISGNRSNRSGAGIYATGETTIINSSIVFNGPDPTYSSTPAGAGIYVPDGRLVIRNSIVAGNMSRLGPLDCVGTIVSGGHNIFGDGTGCTGFDATDLVGTTDALVDPLLGPLANNGGPTQTHALLAGSPAIDGVPVEDCIADLDRNPATPDTPLDVDQRGSHRPGGAACDIGPYEISGSELEAAQCMADLGTAQDEAAQCSANLGGCQGDLTQCGVDLDACLAIPPGLPDQDEDGEADSTDRCAGTPARVAVDGQGCSRAQFCGAIPISGFSRLALCFFSDWRNDQPLSRLPDDCRVVRNGHGRFGFGCTAN